MHTFTDIIVNISEDIVLSFAKIQASIQTSPYRLQNTHLHSLTMHSPSSANIRIEFVRECRATFLEWKAHGQFKNGSRNFCTTFQWAIKQLKNKDEDYNLTAMIGIRSLDFLGSTEFVEESSRGNCNSTPAFTASSQLPVSSNDRISLVAWRPSITGMHTSWKSFPFLMTVEAIIISKTVQKEISDLQASYINFIGFGHEN